MPISKDRQKKMEEVAKRRQWDLRVVLEDLEKSHNISAISRTCDAVGVQFLHVVHRDIRPIRLNKHVSAGSHQWLTIVQHPTIENCLTELKVMGFQIYAAMVDPTAEDFAQVDYTGKIAIVLGNEACGVSETALSLVDKKIVIPQVGFANSLNVATAGAVLLYEAFKQRRQAGLYDIPRMNERDREHLIQTWLARGEIDHHTGKV